VAFLEVEEIDAINIYWAGIQAMQRAVRGLGLTPQHLLIDAKRLKEIDIPQQAIIKGDAKSASIAGASILAKVERDAVMRALDLRHPGYGFADHKGYPVPAHYDALARLGACAAHRRSFGPVRKALGLPPCRRGLRQPSVTPAEQAARFDWRHYFRDQFFSRTTSFAFLSERRPR